jgi:hypothetical protein
LQLDEFTTVGAGGFGLVRVVEDVPVVAGEDAVPVRDDGKLAGLGPACTVAD